MNDFWRQPIQGFPAAYDPWRDAGDCVFHTEVAERVCAYWEQTFTLKDGRFEGQPFKLLPWQRQIVGHLFGWKRPEGTRRYRKLFLYIPKKNGKTELGAGFALILLAGDGEAGAEVYSCASDTDQAKIVFDAAAKMIDHNRALSRAVKIFKGYRSMKYTPRSGYWKVLSSRADSKHGPNVHGLLIDELHTQRDTELIETLEAGTISRAQPLVIKMTTAAHTGDSPCNQELEYARGVRDGTIVDAYYMPVIFDGQAHDAEHPDAWKSEAFWRLVNPSFGVTVNADYFRGEVSKCEAMPSHVNAFKRLHLNVQTDLAESWLDQAAWAACGEAGIDPRGPCYAGLDLASTCDLGALALYWPETKSLRVYTFIPGDTVERRAEYLLWAEHDHIIATPGRTHDYSYIRQLLNRLKGEHDIRKLAYDPWNATHLITELADEDGIPVVEFRQGEVSMNQPAKDFERAVINHELRHENNPCLNWQAGNVCVKVSENGNIKPVKPKPQSTKKVDGIIAAIMARALADADTEEKQPEGSVIILL